MVLAADAAEEQADDLVAHELVDQAVTGQHGPGRDSIEAVEERPAVRRGHPLADGGRAADVREQQGHRGPSAPCTPMRWRSLMQKLQMAGLPA